MAQPEVFHDTASELLYLKFQLKQFHSQGKLKKDIFLSKWKKK